MPAQGVGDLQDWSRLATKALFTSPTWSEVDAENAIWTVPAARMKAGRPHRVPLSPRAVEILQTIRPLGAGTLVFAGQKSGRPLSAIAIHMLLRRMKVDVTVHGFRSSFRDWAGECTSFPREDAEAALAHVVGDATERAYRRGDALGSGLIDHSQKMTVAAMAMADMKVWAQRS